MWQEGAGAGQRAEDRTDSKRQVCVRGGEGGGCTVLAPGRRKGWFHITNHWRVLRSSLKTQIYGLGFRRRSARRHPAGRADAGPARA